MIKNKLKLSIAAGMLLTSCAYAGTVTAANSNNIEISGDVELKMLSEKSGSETVEKRTAEVNLGLESQLKSGTKVITAFRVFDGTQANGGADTFDVTEAYALIPFMKGGELKVGLSANDTYGTDAFDNGGEDWKVSIKVPVMENTSVTLVSSISKEDEANANEGDSGATSFQVDTEVSGLSIGAKYVSAYENKDTATEVETNSVFAFATGEVEGFELGFEAVASSGDKRAFFVSASKEFDALTAGLAYVNLTKGQKGGDDFAVGMILDGNIDSSEAEDTSAFVLPLEYAVNDKLTANATLISASVQGDSASELDLGAAYALNSDTEVSLSYGKYTQDNADDQTNIELAVVIEF